MNATQKTATNLFRRLAKQGKIANIYDKFNHLLLTTPDLGVYAECKQCEASTPHIEDECQLCGTYTTDVIYTYTDTFGGDANFCWAKRVIAKDFRQAKKKLGLNGIRFTKAYDGRWNEIGACRCILSD